MPGGACRGGGSAAAQVSGTPARMGAGGSRRDDRGSMSIFTVIFSVVVFLLAGLLVDGGAAINARLRAADVAEQAARAAADQIDVEYLRATGQARLLEDGTVCDKAEEIVSAHDGDESSLPSARSTKARPRSR